MHTVMLSWQQGLTLTPALGVLAAAPLCRGAERLLASTLRHRRGVDPGTVRVPELSIPTGSGILPSSALSPANTLETS